jgi:hypothetical protein
MKKIPNYITFALISVIITAIILRLIKLYEFSIWGSDSGEHYFLLNQLITTGGIELQYNGWGLAYPYFQGMHLLSSGFSEISGISSFHSLIFVIPIIAGLSVLLIFCIAHRVFRNPRVALVAAGFVAVVLPIVYTSSHPMPGSLGSFLLLACIFLLQKSYDNSNFLMILSITSVALVITHHMSTYFLIISLISIIIVRELLQHPKDEKRTKIDFGFLIFLTTITLLYWTQYAIPFRDNILSNGFPLPVWTIIPIAYLSLGIFYIFIQFRRKNSWRYKPKFYSVKNLLIRVIFMIISGILIMVITSFTGVPGTNMNFHIIGVLYFVPIIVYFSFMAAAPIICSYYKDGLFILAWLIAICVSVIFSSITNSQELLVYRHIPYAFEAIAILTGAGMVKIFDLMANKKDSKFIISENNIALVPELVENINLEQNQLKNRTKRSRTKKEDIQYNSDYSIQRYMPLRYRIAASGFVITILAICGIFSYPPLEVVSGFEEGTTELELEAVIWAQDSLEEDSTVASDHRMSSIMFGFGETNSSWEYAPQTLHSKSISELRNEAIKATVPAGKKRLDYVLITDAISNGVALKQWEPAEPMAKEALDKFETKYFTKIFDNGEAKLYRIGDIENFEIY